MENERKCPAASKCSGCQLSNLSYEQQLRWKQKDVTGLLEGYCGINPIIPMESPYNYRNKVQAVFRSDRNGKILSGVYQSSRNGIVAIDRCMLNDERADRVILGIRELLRSFKISPFSENTGSGFLRHVLVRVGTGTGEMLVTLVGGTRMFPKKKDFTSALVKMFPEITTVTFSVNRTPDFLTPGNGSETLYGNGYITDVLCGKRFRISPSSFYQVNSVQTGKLYDYAINAAGLKGTENILDAYSGIGTIGIIASDRVKSVQGIEYNARAVRDAAINCRENGILKNAAFNKGDAGEYLLDRASHSAYFDVVFMDPPRVGADRNFLRALLKIKPEKIIYISCNPATLARDLKTLTKKYKAEEIQPVDMFPHTRHVECIAALSLVK